MNEYVEPGAAARLVGTPDNPEGLLTSAVRRQPFCVVLLDEIEKAHPEVYDLLLQVIGEGRLTDSLGRATDFCNAIIIMTSNLGVRQAGALAGFGQAEQDQSSIYTQAVADYFRPEFVNRIDRIVPFRRLCRHDVARIANLLMGDVLQREGLARRRFILHVDPDAMERVIDQGYHPLLGARALKRAVERQLAQPLGAHLATIAPNTAAVIGLYAGADGIVINAQPLIHAAQRKGAVGKHRTEDHEEALERAAVALDRIEGALYALRPDGGVVSTGVELPRPHYFFLRGHMERLRRNLRRMQERVEFEKRPRARMGAMRRRGGRRRRTLPTSYVGPRSIRAELFAAEDIHQYLQELAAVAKTDEDKRADRTKGLICEVALLDLLAGNEERGEDQSVVVHIRALDEFHIHGLDFLAHVYENIFNRMAGLEARRLEERPSESAQCHETVVVTGVGSHSLAQLEVGTHLFISEGDDWSPIQVLAVPLGEGENAAEAVDALEASRQGWIETLGAGAVPEGENPFRLRPVIRVYEERGLSLDVRTEMTARSPLTPTSLRRFIAMQLDLPQEFREAESDA